jgi:hypothetical protein
MHRKLSNRSLPAGLVALEIDASAHAAIDGFDPPPTNEQTVKATLGQPGIHVSFS